ncbi:unnamed protein product (macronuclear) [Paramecium tetraurelia]|uniref:non-specific serine/threonine protein kinase n=1 Tax=Paramecium tetraurelia TaxID=5888 RepID=A0C6M4_PARTE|nr:uncharacterized protein GSPATT00035570001 [Paramecium tetraurelia]CAK66441.1 unnamed protein product [Paramecium tetraurelia]|eukprot:XP_001433838.1 hypothetical protein (macronuclear) [Paramecium tetraurelia strain d4-2]
MQQQFSKSALSDFNLVKKLGEGYYSSVYQVQRKCDGQYYAIRRVKIHQHSLKEREDALNNIRTLASLGQYNQDNRILNVIMEFVSGGDLLQILKQGKQEGGIQESEIWTILIQIILGVKILHDNGILHRDLNLENVFVVKTPKGNIYKIGDFNIGKVTRQGNAEIGPPYDVAPEMWKGEQNSRPCDIWLIGCIIYELTAFQHPFRARDIESLYKKVQIGKYDPIPSKYSEDLQQILRMLLQVNPKNRPNCDQILKDPKVVKNSGSLLVEIEQKLGKLNDNQPNPKRENKSKKLHSKQGLNIETKNPVTSQPRINLEQQQQQEQQLRKKSVIPSSQEALLKRKPPLAKPQIASAQKIKNHPQTPQYQGQKVQYKDQNLKNQEQKNCNNLKLQQCLGQQHQQQMEQQIQQKRQHGAGIQQISK